MAEETTEQSTVKEEDISSLTSEQLDEMLVETTKEAETSETTEVIEEKTKEKTKEETEKEQTSTESQQDLEEKVTVSKEEWEKSQKRLKDQELYIQRRGNEIGELRKALDELIRTKQEGLQEKWVADPQQAMDDTMAIRNAQRDQQMLNELERIENTKMSIRKLVPDFDSLVDDMAEIVKLDCFHPNAIAQFRANPYVENLGVLFNVVQRAKALRQVKEYEIKVSTLQQEIDKLKGKPQEIVQKIEKALHSKPSVTASSGKGASEKTPITDVPMQNLTSEQLDKILKQRLKEEGING